MNFIARLGLLIHWIGFLGSMVVALFMFSELLDGGTPNPFDTSLVLIAFFGSNTLGWVLRWLIVGGNIKFLPFDK